MARFSVPSGQIAPLGKYEVSGTGTVTYNAVAYPAPATFFGVAGVTTYTTSGGTPIVEEISQVKGIAALVVVPPTFFQSDPISKLKGISAQVVLPISSFASDKTSVKGISAQIVTPVNASVRRSEKTGQPKILTPNNVDIFVSFWGQSNQVGVGDNTAPVAGSYAQEFKSLTNTLPTLTEPSGENIGVQFQSGYGLQSAFAIRYNQLSGKNIIVDKRCYGGTAATDWATTLSTAAIARITGATGGLIPAYQKILCIFQGENEAANGASTYKESWILAIRRYRATFGQNTKVFFIKIGYQAIAPDSGTNGVNALIQDICENFPNCYVAFDASQINQTTYKRPGDLQHFGQAGLNLIGQGLANSMYNVLSNKL